MLILGISGGLDPVYINREFLFPRNTCHDSAAVLIDDGKVVAAIEEERLNRIKHTNKGALSAIRFCLDSYGIHLNDLDRIAAYGDEKFVGRAMRMAYYRNLEAQEDKDIRDIVHEMLIDTFDEDIDDDKLCFVEHHIAHAVSAYVHSGYDKSLVLTVDAAGDATSGAVMSMHGNKQDLLHTIPIHKSLGLFYLDVIRFLGYDLFDEYKVMGLAPYGNPTRYRSLFNSFYQLLPEGDYTINPEFPHTLCKIGRQRRKGEPLTQDHKDLAAALQETLEDIVFHMLRHYRMHTGFTRLCMAGGVAHNCTLNGKILYSGMFEEVFVQPASHDAGCAIGAAFHALRMEKLRASRSNYSPSQLNSVYWGTDIGSNERILRVLSDWSYLIDFAHCEDVAESGADLLAQGAVIGWVQGRSEFGPRALGNRSILADPRPAEYKDLINSMVKKREAYRPFAPAVLEEFVDDLFDLPRKNMRFPFMTFVVKLQEGKKQLLQATTHIDGTARLQTVSKATNEKFWGLIEAFRKRTGIPALLNTSFNNSSEPIVDSPDDAIVCFLTTGLHYLIIGDYLISKKNIHKEDYLRLVPSLPLHASLIQNKHYVSDHETKTTFEIKSGCYINNDTTILPETYYLMASADKQMSLDSLLTKLGDLPPDRKESVVLEMLELWAKRQIIMRPR